MNKAQIKILAIASIGGHWKQLLRILPPTLESLDKVYVTTHPKCESMVSNNKFYTVSDFSRWDAYKIIVVFVQVLRILHRESPDIVITTGAAPGLVMLAIAKCFGIKTFWIDSVANVESLSLSGKIASRIATRTYTQWPNLENNKILFAGNIFE